MIFEYLNFFISLPKICLFKALYWKRITFKGFIKVGSNFRIVIKKGSKVFLGKCLKLRNNISIRVNENGNLSIGDKTFINDNCIITCKECIEIGKNCLIGPNVVIFDHDHDYRKNITNFLKKKIVIGDNVWIGANSIILKGVTIGDNAVIAAGTVVRENIPNGKIVYNKRELIVKDKI